MFRRIDIKGEYKEFRCLNCDKVGKCILSKPIPENFSYYIFEDGCLSKTHLLSESKKINLNKFKKYLNQKVLLCKECKEELMILQDII